MAEVFNMKDDELREFIGEDGHFSTMFDFSAAVLSGGGKGWYDSRPVSFKEWRSALFASQLEGQGIGCLKANIIENHDEPRGASRYLPEHAQNPRGIKMLGTTSVLLRGIPFLYQGQELGMTNCPFHSIEEFDDISTKDQYRVALEAGLSEEEALQATARFSRDNSRTPMQWNSGANAGFTAGTPWLKVNPNYTSVNVQDEENDEDSVLCYYRRLIALRKSEEYREIFTYGEFIPAFEELDGIFAFSRSLNGRQVMVAANFAQEQRTLLLPGQNAKLLLSNDSGLTESKLLSKQTEALQITLNPCDCAVFELFP